MEKQPFNANLNNLIRLGEIYDEMDLPMWVKFCVERVLAAYRARYKTNE